MSIAVIIPSKEASNCVACVKSVRAMERSVRIIVVDDFRTHDDRLALHQGLIDTPGIGSLCTVCEVVWGVQPFIFARNVNIGILAAGSDDVVLLNDDALLQTTGGFSLLAQAAKDNPEYGIIAAVTNAVGNRNQMPRGIGLREEPRMVCFVCVYIPRATIEKVGLLDETIGRGGFEDDDYCLRVRRAGLKIGIHDDSFVDHGSLKSTFRSPGGPGYDPMAAQNFKNKWGADNHAL